MPACLSLTGMLKLFDICKVKTELADGNTVVVLAENTDGIRKKLLALSGAAWVAGRRKHGHTGICVEKEAT